MRSGQSLLGIDIGSVSICLAQIDRKLDLIQWSYAFHSGKPGDCLERMFRDFDLSRVVGISATSSSPAGVKADFRVDDRLCQIRSCRQLHKRLGSILIVGGERFGLISFDSAGNYSNYRTNSSCAAGTGSFLDQQARRLKLNGAEELCAVAEMNTSEVPKIASRCAVFAKTDLTHAQQQGYTLPQICDALCLGLAHNVVETVCSGSDPLAPIAFIGGVSQNRAVTRHLGNLLQQDLLVSDCAVHGALGAALLLADDGTASTMTVPVSGEGILPDRATREGGSLPALVMQVADYPDFGAGAAHFLFEPQLRCNNPVEVDQYEELSACEETSPILGIDIGSTSTKAALLSKEATVLAGFYTRTGGNPLHATQSIFAAIEDLFRRRRAKLNIQSVGTTGSGRKFIGRVIGADSILNEISAHARAAVMIHPEVDTIVEIGGQDSKFTTLRNGAVTFSIMNSVCAAGTGSFIEELADRLGCPLQDISARTSGCRAPVSSDRCTVFMERDVNHFLNTGYSVDEVLASVLHSVRENYLTKVALESQIGENIVFQGATAKIRSLVAAFEQRLQKPIYVSRFCHLTGAIGVALELLQNAPEKSNFRGLDIHRKQIPVYSEVCQICRNHCKLTLADIEGDRVAFGFLCGRDYETRNFVRRNTSGFDLYAARSGVFKFQRRKVRHPGVRVAIPAALHLHEDLPFWKYFFNELGVRVETSQKCSESVSAGKLLTGAEFCAPVTALHGNVDYLLKKRSRPGERRCLFLPVYLEVPPGKSKTPENYCYYTQFAPSLVSQAAERSGPCKAILTTPLIRYLYHPFHTKAQLYRMMGKLTKDRISFFEVSRAFDKAVEFKNRCLDELKRVYKEEKSRTQDLFVVLLGRPYSALNPSMNKRIPEIFDSLGVKVFYQDMVNAETGTPLLDRMTEQFHWHYAKQVLEAAQAVAETSGAYPVLVTSFKCTPDSFVIEYFKELMEAHHKPYLILQLDEHSSNVGYETRIEAAVDSFGNHFSQSLESEVGEYPITLFPKPCKSVESKTVLLPDWDTATFRLIAASLRKEGIDARLLKGSDASIRRSLRLNNGQCIPIHVIAEEFIEYIQTNDLDPCKTVLWVARSNLACNIHMFPGQVRRILMKSGSEIAKAQVYVGDLSFLDVSVRLPMNIYFSFMLGGFLRKLVCFKRPYECQPGLTDQVAEECLEVLEQAFLGECSREHAVREVVKSFRAIPTRRVPRPKVAVFGDLYVRDNDTFNQDLIRFVELHGGEVVTVPYSSLIKMIARPYLRKWIVEGSFLDAISSKAFIMAVAHLERTYLQYFQEILGEFEPTYSESPERILANYKVRIEHSGESMENLLKVFYIKKHHPEISLFVQTSPAFCCPSLVTQAMSFEIEKRTGVPVVSITYDGTGGNKNEAIIPYLKFPRTTQSDFTELSRVSS